MSKILLVGPAGCGKSRRVIDEFSKTLQTSADPLQPEAFLVLPSLEHADCVSSLLLQNGVKGFFHRRVTTLTALASAVFGPLSLRKLSDAERFFILRELIERHQWEYFLPLSPKGGVLHLIGGFLNELEETLISPELFREKMNALKTLEPGMALKYEALAGIYEAYSRSLEEKGIERPSDLLKKIRNAYRRVPGTEGTGFRTFPVPLKLWFDGFFDFTPLQLELVRELTDFAGETTITVTRNPGAKRLSLFDPVLETEEALLNMGFEREVMKTGSGRTQKPALLFLEQNIFSADAAGKGGTKKQSLIRPGGEDLKIFRAVGMRGEVEMIGRHILKTCRQGDYRFSDFAVLFRQVGSYEPLIRSVFSRYGIPFEIHERSKTQFSPLMHAAVKLLRIFRFGWRIEDLIDFLKTSYLKLSEFSLSDYSWISLLETLARRNGVQKNREDWFLHWKSALPGIDGELFQTQKIRVLKPLRDLEETLLRLESGVQAQKKIWDFVRYFFELTPLSGSSVPAEEVHAERKHLARLESLLQETAEGLDLPGTGYRLDLFLERFFRLVDLDVYILHQRDRNRVQIYDISHARQKEYRIVFVAGLAEKSFPIMMKEDPLLSDFERRLIAEGGRMLLKERLPRQNMERYLFYLAVTRASETLILSYPRLDMEGKENLPSLFLEETEALFKPHRLQKDEQELARPYPSLENAVSRRELEESLAGTLRHQSGLAENAILAVLCRLFQDPQVKSRFKTAFSERETGLKDAVIREGDFFHTSRVSPTRLEDFSLCPFKHFAGRVLQLKDPDEDTEFRVKGTVLHETLQRFFEARREGKPETSRLDAAKIFMAGLLDEALLKNPVLKEKKYQADLDRSELEETLNAFLEYELERLKASPLQPRYFEYSFGKEEPFRIETPDGPVALTGSVDRIDTDPEETVAMVYDYKRSSKFDRKNLLNGLSLQLPLYLMVAEKRLGLKPAGGALYCLRECAFRGFYHADYERGISGKGPKTMRLNESEYRSLMTDIAKYVGYFTSRMKELDMRPVPRKDKMCGDFCPFIAVCRMERWQVPALVARQLEEDRLKLGIGGSGEEAES